MAYGLRVKKSDGTIIFDTNYLVGRIRYSTVASAGTSDSIVLSDISGKTTYPFSLSITGGVPHNVEISGTTFSWTGQSYDYGGSGDSLVGIIIVD